MEDLTLFLEEFAGLCAIPRPSGDEKAICDYLFDRLRGMGLSPRRDAVHNLICDVPPTAGIQMTPPLALQAHIDMVCVGAPDYRDRKSVV